MKDQRKTVGSKGEKIARDYLEARGLRFVENDFNIWGGQIDLIMKEDEEFVFVEVKSRNEINEEGIGEIISNNQIKVIIRTAEIWLYNNDYEDQDWRIDLVVVFMRDNKCEWIKDCLN